MGGAYHSEKLLVETSFAKSQDQAGTFEGDVKPKVVSDITTKRDQFGLLAEYELSKNTSFVGGFDWYEEEVKKYRV